MFLRMLVKGGILIAGIITAEAVIEKLEKASLERKEVSNKIESEKEGDNTDNLEWVDEIMAAHGYHKVEEVK